jgi:hypothetical protein
MNDFREYFQQYGWEALPRMFKSLFRRIGIIKESFVLLEYSINERSIDEKISSYSYSDVSYLTLVDINKFKDITPEKKELFKERFLDNSHSCYGILDNNKVVYFTWISWKYMNYPSIFNKSELLNHNEALLEDSFCNPDYRGKGYHSKMNLYRLSKIKDSKKEKVLALVLKENGPALKVQRKSGFRIVKKISFFKIGKWSKIKEKEYHDRD